MKAVTPRSTGEGPIGRALAAAAMASKPVPETASIVRRRRRQRTVAAAPVARASLPPQRYGGAVPAPLLAVDAPSMLFRAFYALPASITGSDGKPVNALLGAANLILRDVERHDPRAVVLCFGPDAAHYRVELFPNYHADRDELPKELAPQWADSRDFFEAFGWTVASHDSLEADDLLGSYARREAEAGGSALLLTGDRDMFQCASEQVSVLYVRTGGRGAEVVTPEEVERRYGVPPELVPDFIALRGDPSDGIPGAKGVGEKTAAELLRRHGPLEAVLDAAIGESRPKLRGALLDARDDLLVFKQLATLQEAGVERLPDRPTDWEGAARAARERGMNRLAERLEGGA
ncbi:MAG: 5'-3' exonuclease [Actinomycetota bacterium]